MSISVIVSFHERSNSNAFISELPYLNPNSYGEPFGAYLVLGKPHLIVDIYSIQQANKALVKGKQLFLILNAVQATYYAIQNGDQLLLEPVKEIYSSDKIELVPKSVNDFKIISETATLIEDIFLDQIRIVKEGMVLLLWVKSNVYVCLTVKTVQPILDNEAVFKLSNSTEVVVESLNEIAPNSSPPPLAEANLLEYNTFKIVNKRYRVQEISDLPYSSIIISDNSIPYGIYFVSCQSYKDTDIACLKNQPKYVKSEHCIISSNFKFTEGLQIIFNSLPFSKLKQITKAKLKLFKLDNLPKISIEKENVYKYLKMKNDFTGIIFNSTGILINQNYGVYQSTLEHDQYGYFYTDSFPDMSLEFDEDKLPDLPKKEDINEIVNYGRVVKCEDTFTWQIEFIEKHFTKLLHYFANNIVNTCKVFVLEGPLGSGRSQILKQIGKGFFKNESGYVHYEDVNEHRGKDPSKIFTKFEKICFYLKKTEPSLLLLDNFDALYVTFNDEERTISKLLLITKLLKLINTSKITTILVCKDLDFLKKIDLTRNNFINDTFKIPQLSQADQIEVLTKWCGASKDTRQFDEVVKVTECWGLSSMKRLAHRIIIGAAGGGISDDGAMAAYDALSTIGSASTKAGNFNEIEWEDVVGMEEAKQILTETILWSSKYQELYKACPIRLGRAVLLHGASGSGKTYLMRALIKEANLFTITVNGPELLSKYIGSSEENVRKTFQKARQNKPSLIIFDEFDGLAPKRGHDSTGVTDRVVNQLLTEMDGVEGMDGVFVVGATTRIDLIDSALLRPGRFDHKVECVFPSQIEIVTFLLKYLPKMGMVQEEKITPNDLVYIATDMDNWSFGEIKGMLTNCYFLALKRVDEEDEDSKIVVTKEDLQKAVIESRPKRLVDKGIVSTVRHDTTGTRTSLA